MPNPDRPIKEFMTPAPHGIAPTEPLAVAAARMQELRVRHLPVRTGGRVVGIVSERDLELLRGTQAIDFKVTPITAAMVPDPYCVGPSSSAASVGAEWLNAVSGRR